MKGSNVKTIAIVLIMTMMIQIVGNRFQTQEQKVYAESTLVEDSSNVNGTVNINGTSSIGEIIANEIENEQLSEKSAYAGIVFSVEMEPQALDENMYNAYIAFQVDREAILMVCIFDEESETLASTEKVSINEGDTYVECEIGDVPEYFIVKAYIIAKESYKPLSEEYVSIMYTHDMVMLKNSTIDDYDEERVVNLDDSKETNFVVYNENVVILESADKTNIINKSSSVDYDYVISNTDDVVRNLKAGDIFAGYCEEEAIVGYIADIHFQEDDAYIACSMTTIEQVFDVVKIECENDVDFENASNLILGDNVTQTQNDNDIELFTSGDWSTEYESKLGELSAIIEFGIGYDFELYVSWGELSSELYIDYEAAIELSFGDIENEIVNYEFEDDFFEIDIPLCCGIDLDIEFDLVFKAAAEISVTGTLSGRVGFTLSTEDGCHSMTTTPQLSMDCEIKGECFFGFEVGVEIDALEELMEGGIEGEIGFELENTKSFLSDNNYSSRHYCEECFESTLNLVCSLGVEAKINLGFFGEWTYEKNITPTLEKEIASYYNSTTYGTSGREGCPYHQYRVNFTIVDENMRPIEGAVVHGTSKVLELMGESPNTCAYSNIIGKCNMMMDEGPQAIMVICPEYDTVTMDIYVKKPDDEISTPNEVTLVLSKFEKETEEMTEEETTEVETTTEEEITEEETTVDDRERLGIRTIKSVQVSVADYIMGNYELKILFTIFTNDNKLWTKSFLIDNSLAIDTEYIDVSDAILLMENVENVYAYDNIIDIVTCDGRYYEYNCISDTTEYIADNVLYAERRTYISLDRELYVKDKSQPIMSNVKDIEVSDQVKDSAFDKYPKIEKSNDEKNYLVYAINEEGTLYGYGNNEWNQMAVKNCDTSYYSYMVEIMKDVSWINTDGNSAAAITKNGELYVWGECYEDAEARRVNIDTPMKIYEGVKKCFITSLTDEDDILFISDDNRRCRFTFSVDYDESTGYYIDCEDCNVVKCDEEGDDIFEDMWCGLWGLCVGKNINGEFTLSIWFKGVTEIGTNGKKYSEEINECLDGNFSLYNERINSTYTDDDILFNSNEIYNIYAFKTLDCDDILADENILHIGQTTTDDNGLMYYTYEIREEFDNPIVLYKKMSYDNISEANVEVKAQPCNGEIQYAEINVTYNGDKLVEGRDYIVSDDYFYTDMGMHYFTIYGKGDFNGNFIVEYEVDGRVDLTGNYVDANGLQISTTIGGIRTVYTIESEIDGLEVEDRGLVYGLKMGATEEDMYIGADSEYIAHYSATPSGAMSSCITGSETATTYAMTMTNDITTTSLLGLTAEYMVRAYAKLSDGTYVYSDIMDYSVYNVSKYMYDNIKMPRKAAHEYLYTYVLSKVDPDYPIVKFPLSNTIVKP